MTNVETAALSFGVSLVVSFLIYFIIFTHGSGD